MTDNGKEYTPDYSVLNKWPIINWEWPKIVVFIPWMQALPYADEVLPSFLEIARQGPPFIHLSYGYAERVHNLAAWEFLAHDWTHLLVLDSDHVHPPDIIQRLARHVIEDPGRLIVGGLNYRRTPPYSPCLLVEYDGKAARPVEWNETGLMEVLSLGTANIMIARQVFEKLEPPWFINEYNEAIHTTGGYDTYFCNKARDAGIKMWVDMSLTSPHMGTHRIGEKTFRTYMGMHPLPEDEVINVKTEIYRERNKPAGNTGTGPEPARSEGLRRGEVADKHEVIFESGDAA